VPVRPVPHPAVLRPFVLAATAAIALAGCGGSTKPTEPESSLPAATSSQASTPTTPASTPTTPAATAPARPKPRVRVPSGPPPKRLVVKDLIRGTGPAARAGQSVTVNYVGVLYRGGKQFDASYDAGQPFTFTLGQGGVIKGWDQGVAGMRIGGRRELIIPPGLAYGPQGSPPKIGPNQTLVFVIDLLSAS
jgi:peptidylprolyl isomerase